MSSGIHNGHSISTDSHPAEGLRGFDGYYTRFLAEVLQCQATPKLAWADSMTDPSSLDPAKARKWEDETSALVKSTGPEYGQLRQARQDRLTASIARVADQVDGASLVRFVSNRISVHSTAMIPRLPDRDLIYIKVNHGFWEQIYALFGTYHPVKMRIADAAGYRTSYADSGFLDALECLLRKAATDDGQEVRFETVRFGISLLNGSIDHGTLLSRLTGVPPERHVVTTGAAIGVIGYFDSIYGERRLIFDDGCFPKQGLADGTLRKTLHAFAAQSDRIVFAIPPHLGEIQLSECPLPQEQVFVSGAKVHESWAVTLYATARQILGRLESDDRVMVITQSAVFSALLGLFLKMAKDSLFPASKRLHFFDLGQVTDIANPNCGGVWISKHDIPDKSLFRIAGTPSSCENPQ